MTDQRIAIIVGSTRPSRICPAIAGWAHRILEPSPLSYELVDLAEVDLPFLDEPLMAALGHYEHPHTRRWSQTISAFDGFLFVYPQYNWGYPGVLKNALDFLFTEWNGRPATFLTYGGHNGSASVEPFTRVLTSLRMNLLETHIEAHIGRSDVNQQWQLIDPATTLEPVRGRLLEIDRQFRAAMEPTA
ncbi:NADPH-dependent FMN reductase [Acidipropionibacterium thoenii]|uniref:NADPH-dependent FMN reductase n=1 Tax=Acidipropionibacterium thoenii TaxID=1751 RepID=UPI00041A3936|nr:NAD(P)H-dependent oxidoreductase [Acidipropionibacterium thoenii]